MKGTRKMEEYGVLLKLVKLILALWDSANSYLFQTKQNQTKPKWSYFHIYSQSTNLEYLFVFALVGLCGKTDHKTNPLNSQSKIWP